jgi:hypothetical protein
VAADQRGLDLSRAEKFSVEQTSAAHRPASGEDVALDRDLEKKEWNGDESGIAAI